MNMLPNSTSPSAAYQQAWQEAEAAHGVRLAKFFAPAKPIQRNDEAFAQMLRAMVGDEEMARMVQERERYNEVIRREMRQYYETGRIFYGGEIE